MNSVNVSPSMNQDENEMDFSDLRRIRVRVKILERTYVLAEATGSAHAAYKNTLISAMKLGTDGSASIKSGGGVGIADADLVLLAGCLYEVVPKKGENGSTVPNVTEDIPVPLNIIRGWPTRLTTPLIERSKIISGIDERKKTTREELEGQIQEGQKKLADLALEEESSKNVVASMIVGSE